MFALGFSFPPTVCGGSIVFLLQANRTAFSASLLLVVLGLRISLLWMEFQLLFGICAPDPELSRLSSAPEPSCSRALGSGASGWALGTQPVLSPTALRIFESCFPGAQASGSLTCSVYNWQLYCKLYFLLPLFFSFFGESQRTRGSFKLSVP